jgi:hypothetical protein
MVHRPALPKKLAYAFVAGDISRNRFCAQLSRSRLQAVGVTRCNDDISALVLCKFGCRQTYTGGAANDNNLLTCKQHKFVFIVQNSGQTIA